MTPATTKKQKAIRGQTTGRQSSVFATWVVHTLWLSLKAASPKNGQLGKATLAAGGEAQKRSAIMMFHNYPPQLNCQSVLVSPTICCPPTAPLPHTKPMATPIFSFLTYDTVPVRTLCLPCAYTARTASTAEFIPLATLDSRPPQNIGSAVELVVRCTPTWCAAVGLNLKCRHASPLTKFQAWTAGLLRDLC